MNKNKFLKFTRKNLELIQNSISSEYPFSEQELREIEDHLNWDFAIWNENIPWTLDLVKKYEYKWQKNSTYSCETYETLRNPTIYNIDGILDYLSKRWDIPFLLKKGIVGCTEDTFERFTGKIDISPSSYYSITNLDFVEKYQDRLNLKFITPHNINLTEDFIEKFSHKLNWRSLSLSIPLSISLIDKFTNYWDWEYLSKNRKMEWTEDVINYYWDKINWYSLSSNSGLRCSNNFLEKHAQMFEWGNHGLSRVASINWTEEFIEKHVDDLGWGMYGISWNSGLPWTMELINRYEKKWDWDGLSLNKGLNWTIELIEKYKDKWDWGTRWRSYGLSNNKLLPWSIEFIETYKDRLTDSWSSNPSVWEKVINPNLNFDLVKKILTMK